MTQKSNMQHSIVFLDSGVGGLPYLERCAELLPGTSMHYLADDEGFPYGTKDPSLLLEILHDRVRRLRSRFLPSALVIACNTASQVGLKALREAHPGFPIIGTVPAIKPAAAGTKSGKIGVMATERTTIDPYIDDLIARYATEVEVVKLAAQDLVSFVEKDFLASTPEQRIAAVDPYVRELLAAGVDRIVLACTHFLHLEKDIALCLERRRAADVQIVDSREGVARRLAQVAAENGIRGGEPLAERGKFILTRDPPFDPEYAKWAGRFRLGEPEQL